MQTNVSDKPSTPDIAPPSDNDIELLAQGKHYNPHSILGAHTVEGGTAIRALKPNAESVVARIGDADYPLTHVAHGVFSGVVPFEDLMDYRLAVTWPGGHTAVSADGYRFLPTLGELDLHLFGEGRHERLWDILAARNCKYREPRDSYAEEDPLVVLPYPLGGLGAPRLAVLVEPAELHGPLVHCVGLQPALLDE